MQIPAPVQEFLTFGWKSLRSCVFAGSFLALLVISTIVPLPIARYDFLFIGALVIQAVLIATKIETIDEAKTIFAFHIIGLVLELFKTHPSIGSWSYPEEGFFKIGTVPLYSGFMYASIGSYISQAWRIQKLNVTGYPPYRYSIPLAILIYGNFFTNHWLYDIRWFLFVAVLIIFRKTWVEFRITDVRRRMPLVLSFILIGFFIWIAENIASYFGAWQYPNQLLAWHPVSLSKISSWLLLVILSIMIVFDLKIFKQQHAKNVS